MGNNNGKPTPSQTTAISPKQPALVQGTQALKQARADVAGHTDQARQHYQASIKHLQQALAETHQPKPIQELLAQAHLELGDLWHKQQKNTEARSHYEQAQKLGHSDAQLRQKQLAQSVQVDIKHDSKTNADPLACVIEFTPALFQLENKDDKASFPIVFKRNPAALIVKTDNKDEPQNTQQLAQRLAQSPKGNKAYGIYRKQALDVVELFGQSKNKDQASITEVTALAASNDAEITHLLLKHFVQSIHDGVLLVPALLEGLAFVLKAANPVHLNPDDLIKILAVLEASRNTLFNQQPDKLFSLLVAITRLLDVMVDCEVKGLSRENLHEPLYESLKGLKTHSNKQIGNFATYACQALVRIPNDEARLRCVLRHVLTLGQGAASIAGAIKNVDLTKLLEGFSQLGTVVRGVGQGINSLAAGLSQAGQNFSAAIADVNTDAISSGLQQIGEGKKFLEKTVNWYDELRFAELLLEAGHFTALEQFIKKLPGQLEPAFMWGVLRLLEKTLQQNPILECRIGLTLLLGQIFTSAKGWDDRSAFKQQAAQAFSSLSRRTFFGRLIKEDTFWGDPDYLRLEVLRLLLVAASDPDEALRSTAITVLVCLKKQADEEQRALLTKEIPDITLLQPRPVSLPVFSTYLLDAALKRDQQRLEGKLDNAQQHLISIDQKMDVSTQVKQLLAQHRQRLLLQSKTNQSPRSIGAEDIAKGLSLYIPQQAKYHLEDEKSFDLYQDVVSFLIDQKTEAAHVLLLLGSAGTGKTLFGRYFERLLWQAHKPGACIPLFISLASIKEPAHNLIEKTLRKWGLQESHIAYLKAQHHFLFWLDGYDEIRCQENLITSNRLMDWQAKIVITCRSEYLQQKQQNYRLKFAPNRHGKPQFQALRECHLAPFSESQIKDYLANFVKQENSLWNEVSRYEIYLNKLPGLQEMVKLPFLLFIAARVLPGLAAKHRDHKDFVKVTRADLYEDFLSEWFSHQLGKLTEQNRLALLGKEPEKVLRAYTQKLAAAMRRTNTSVIEYKSQTAAEDTAWHFSLNPLTAVNAAWSLGNAAYHKAQQLSGYAADWAEFFKDDPRTMAIRLACPLVKVGEHRYRFIHDSLQEYLVAREQFDEVSAQVKLMAPRPLTQAQAKRKAVQTNEAETTLTVSSLQTAMLQLNKGNNISAVVGAAAASASTQYTGGSNLRTAEIQHNYNKELFRSVVSANCFSFIGILVNILKSPAGTDEDIKPYALRLFHVAVINAGYDEPSDEKKVFDTTFASMKESTVDKLWLRLSPVLRKNPPKDTKLDPTNDLLPPEDYPPPLSDIGMRGAFVLKIPRSIHHTVFEMLLYGYYFPADKDKNKNIDFAMDYIASHPDALTRLLSSALMYVTKKTSVDYIESVLTKFIKLLDDAALNDAHVKKSGCTYKNNFLERLVRAVLDLQIIHNNSTLRVAFEKVTAGRADELQKEFETAIDIILQEGSNRVKYNYTSSSVADSKSSVALQLRQEKSKPAGDSIFSTGTAISAMTRTPQDNNFIYQERFKSLVSPNCYLFIDAVVKTLVTGEADRAIEILFAALIVNVGSDKQKTEEEIFSEVYGGDDKRDEAAKKLWTSLSAGLKKSANDPKGFKDATKPDDYPVQQNYQVTQTKKFKSRVVVISKPGATRVEVRCVHEVIIEMLLDGYYFPQNKECAIDYVAHHPAASEHFLRAVLKEITRISSNDTLKNILAKFVDYVNVGILNKDVFLDRLSRASIDLQLALKNPSARLRDVFEEMIEEKDPTLQKEFHEKIDQIAQLVPYKGKYKYSPNSKVADNKSAPTATGVLPHGTGGDHKQSNGTGSAAILSPSSPLNKAVVSVKADTNTAASVPVATAASGIVITPTITAPALNS